MNLGLRFFIFLLVSLTAFSCVSKKQFVSLQTELDAANKDLGKCGESLNDYMNRLSACEQDKARLNGDIRNLQNSLQLRAEQMEDLKTQLADVKAQRDKQLNQVEGLTTLSQSASDNIKETLSQLERKDKYIHLLQAAKTRADSINLALAVNLKGVLSQGIEDKDVEVKVDKTVVFVNLSDKMLYQSGSFKLTPRANEVLGKIAQIIQSRPELEVMVEGYTDNVPIKNSCIDDNWDLSVKRATSVVRALQQNHGVDPNRLIAAGRGEYNTLATNSTAEGRSTNRRTRIIILPKLDQFYDLLNPNLAPK
ncbi:MAG: OmpA family protein [Lewinellaceae bacterium]|nr:OmpA family protein [Phaeodactylibacter sp.]MCB0612582.1 OmpA family protein [Phaeodactylibacter sp.]MCB9351567.1 OmpA family protein [Lewinellaceae bacterium]